MWTYNLNYNIFFSSRSKPLLSVNGGFHLFVYEHIHYTCNYKQGKGAFVTTLPFRHANGPRGYEWIRWYIITSTFWTYILILAPNWKVRSYKYMFTHWDVNWFQSKLHLCIYECQVRRISPFYKQSKWYFNIYMYVIIWI